MLSTKPIFVTNVYLGFDILKVLFFCFCQLLLMFIADLWHLCLIHQKIEPSQTEFLIFMNIKEFLKKYTIH
jgi:hypothetical protein